MEVVARGDRRGHAPRSWAHWQRSGRRAGTEKHFAARFQVIAHAVCMYRNTDVCHQRTYFDPPIHATMIRDERYKLNPRMFITISTRVAATIKKNLDQDIHLKWAVGKHFVAGSPLVSSTSIGNRIPMDLEPSENGP
ncbi:hypothetical protein [Microbulbifer rhizosphaerae]|uniref:Uncharacterized protein n=1 Tax=Microbulbifer rhizosphaerae TaxID=1562603 RepID=A0A7W4W8V5_9GAMM|nr:hypothetical protein [Microbulbifer rhizosphaerae]MBB3059806.1 hypothetical protein [Microbulbifer rhizosphaerae]